MTIFWWIVYLYAGIGLVSAAVVFDDATQRLPGISLTAKLLIAVDAFLWWPMYLYVLIRDWRQK